MGLSLLDRRFAGRGQETRFAFGDDWLVVGGGGGGGVSG